MNYNYNKLKGRIVENYGNVSRFADVLGVSPSTMSLKLDGKRNFKMREIEQCLNLLNIDRSQISDYFFAPGGDDDEH